jgi:hypothetical protein
MGPERSACAYEVSTLRDRTAPHRYQPPHTHGPTGGVRPEGIGVLQLALPVLICQFFLSKYNGNTVSLLGYFRITFG